MHANRRYCSEGHSSLGSFIMSGFAVVFIALACAVPKSSYYLVRGLFPFKAIPTQQSHWIQHNQPAGASPEPVAAAPSAGYTSQ